MAEHSRNGKLVMFRIQRGGNERVERSSCAQLAAFAALRWFGECPAHMNRLPEQVGTVEVLQRCCRLLVRLIFDQRIALEGEVMSIPRKNNFPAKGTKSTEATERGSVP